MANKREISRGGVGVGVGVGDNVTWRKVKLTKLPCRGANSVANLWNRAADEATPLSILYTQGTRYSTRVQWTDMMVRSVSVESRNRDCHARRVVRSNPDSDVDFYQHFSRYIVSVDWKRNKLLLGGFDSCTRLSSTTMCLTIKQKGTNTFFDYTKTKPSFFLRYTYILYQRQMHFNVVVLKFWG